MSALYDMESYTAGFVAGLGKHHADLATVKAERDALRGLLVEARDFAQCVRDKSMSRNNADAMASELVERIDAALAAKGEGA